MQETPTSLDVQGLVKRHSADVQIGPISFSVREGEFFSLLGTSGCGKTTILRCIAGFETVDEGTITLQGERLDTKPPHKRSVGLVFQNLTLFPHLTAAQNVAFSLVLRKIDNNEIERRVEQMLDLVELGGLGARMPHQLSGGQQQRVALARSLILEPPLMLMDEPLSSLDLKLRIQMRGELRRLQRRLKKTTIFVTHDQTEALALSDRIAVLSLGRIEQIGTPREIYDRPNSSYVADFIGSSNLLRASVVGENAGELELQTSSGLKLKATRRRAVERGPITALIRPERIRVVPAGSANGECPNQFVARVVDTTYLGEDVQLRVMVGGKDVLLVSLKSGSPGSFPGDLGDVDVSIAPDDIFLLDD